MDKTTWQRVKLGEIGKITTGKTPSQNNPQDWGDETLFITPSDYKNYYKYAKNSIRKISKEGKTRFKNIILPKNSILVTCIGSDMGKVVINYKECLTNQQINSITPNAKVLYNFLYYHMVFLYPVLKNFGLSGTAIPILNKSDFENIEISLPPLETQHKIAEILSSLDDKIDLLHRQNKTLESLALTLFRHSFIDNPKRNEWQIGKLGDYIEIFDNKRIPLSKLQRDKMKAGTLYPYYGAANIMDYVNDFIFDGAYILMGEDGTVETEDGYPILQYASGKFWVNNHAHIFKAKAPYNDFFILNFLKQTNISHIVTGAVQPKINQENLKSIPFCKYPIELVSWFIEATNTYFDKINANKKQIQNLQSMRDMLLAKILT